MDHVITSIYDQYHPISILADFLRDASGVKMLRLSEDPYILARLMKGCRRAWSPSSGPGGKEPGPLRAGPWTLPPGS